MNGSTTTRRAVLRRTTLAATAAALAQVATGRLGAEEAGGEQVIPFVEPQPIDPNKPTLHLDELKDWITPKDQFYSVSHYGTAEVKLDGCALDVGGLVDKPKSLSLEQVKAMPRKEITATIECSGNGASAKFCGALANAKWAGTPLAGLLKECGVSPDAIEVALWGHDKGKEKIRGGEYEQHFARSLSMADAVRDDVILAWEMNGEPLTIGHGAPLRLVVPGWYGIAWVKWLSRIEVRNHRLANRFMAKDYVTLRGEEQPDGTVAWEESTVGPMNVKSIVARVVRRKDGGATVTGAAWSGLNPVQVVEVKVDDGEWMAAKIDATHGEPYTWRFWSFDWRNPTPGEHALVSRAIDSKANIQPAADDPAIKLKKTYWEANQQWVRRVRV